MRPRPVVGEATVPDAVRRLLDKFDYPDRESPAQLIPILPTLGGGGVPTVVVAASDASDLSKSKADLLCTGVDDQVVIQAGISIAQPGRVLLTEGLFKVRFDGSFNVISSDTDSVTLEGLGKDITTFQVQDSYDGVEDSLDIVAIEFGTSFCAVRNLAVTGGDGTFRATGGISIGDYGIIEDCYIAPDGLGVYMSGSNPSLVINNILENTRTGIYTDAASASVIAHNILNFVGRHGIHLDALTTECLVQGNVIVSPGGAINNTFDGILLENSDRNDLWNNRIIGAAASPKPRYGINVSTATCDDNSYLGNRTGPAADYGTGAYNDAGAGTVNTWPGAAAPQGDNLL